jgi:CRP-like cAMP-binding protein
MYQHVSGSMAHAKQTDRARAAGRGEKVESGVANALAYVTLFSLCSKRELKLVAKLAKTKKMNAGTTIVTEGETGETMFVLLSGRATVKKGGRKLAERGAGDVIGELAVLTKSPRNATVTLTSDAELATISRRDVYRLIEDAPGFARKLLEALANRVQELDRRAVTS